MKKMRNNIANHLSNEQAPRLMNQVNSHSSSQFELDPDKRNPLQSKTVTLYQEYNSGGFFSPKNDIQVLDANANAKYDFDDEG
jgi:hypothetical protein